MGSLWNFGHSLFVRLCPYKPQRLHRILFWTGDLFLPTTDAQETSFGDPSLLFLFDPFTELVPQQRCNPTPDLYNQFDSLASISSSRSFRKLPFVLSHLRFFVSI